MGALPSSCVSAFHAATVQFLYGASRPPSSATSGKASPIEVERNKHPADDLCSDDNLTAFSLHAAYEPLEKVLSLCEE